MEGSVQLHAPAYLPHMKKVWFPFNTWLGGSQDMYRRFAKGIENLFLSKIGPRILRRPARNVATVPTHLFLLAEVLLHFPNKSICY